MLNTGNIACIFNNNGLQAKAQPKYRHFILTRPAEGTDLAFNTAYAETPGDNDPVHITQTALRAFHRLAFIGSYPAHVRLCPVAEAAGFYSFSD